MFQNYLQTALRTFRREKLCSLINLLGFSAGIACFLIAGLYLNHELRFDQHFENHKNIYRVAAARTNRDSTIYTALGPPLIGPILSNSFPEVLGYVHFTRYPTLPLFREQDNVTDWDNIYGASANVFDMFSHNIIYGDATTALVEPQSIAISELVAIHYFGNDNPIGETISERGIDYKVTLVFENLPDNTHLKYDALISLGPNQLMLFEGRQRAFILLFTETYYTYLEMPPHYDPSAFKGISEQYSDANLGSFDEEVSLVHALEPLSEIHLNSSTERDLPRGNKSSSYILSALALAVLLVACINYVNLATARSSRRAKEIAIRKVLGATRKQLFLQFMLESLCFVFLAFLIGIGLLYFLVNFTGLNQLLETAGILSNLSQPILVFGLIVAVVIIALLSGIYPALYLASVSPNAILKGSAHSGPGATAVRRGLLMLQFTLSIIIVSSTYLMYSQLYYINGRPLGYDKQNKIFVDVKGRENILRLDSLIAELESHNSILGVTVTQSIPGEVASISTPFVETNEGTRQSMTINHVIADDKYLDVMGIQLLEGRNLDPADRDEIGRTNLVNEAFVKFMGWDEPLGKKVGTWQVTGIVRDFHFQSLHEAVEPLVLRLDQENLEREDPQGGNRMRRKLIISLAPTGLSDTLQFIAEKWSAFNPEQPFAYGFLDESLDQLYESDRQQADLIGIAAILCIVISGLGIFALSAFNAEQNIKEIGVRRVLGASALQIVRLHFNKLVSPVLVAAVLGALVSYWIISIWLQSFYYRESLNLMAFVLSTALLIAVVFCSTAIQFYRAARQSLVSALRYE